MLSFEHRRVSWSHGTGSDFSRQAAQDGGRSVERKDEAHRGGSQVSRYASQAIGPQNELRSVDTVVDAAWLRCWPEHVSSDQGCGGAGPAMSDSEVESEAEAVEEATGSEHRALVSVSTRAHH